MDPSCCGKMWEPGIVSDTAVIRIVEGMAAAADVAASVAKGLSGANASFTGFDGLVREANSSQVSTALAGHGKSCDIARMVRNCGRVRSTIWRTPGVSSEDREGQLHSVSWEACSGDKRLRREDSVFLVSREQLLCIHDVPVSRCVKGYNPVYFSSVQAPRVGFRSAPRRDIESVFKRGDDVLNEFGNGGYVLFKELEPICVGVYLREYDFLPTKERFLENVLESTSELDRAKYGF